MYILTKKVVYMELFKQEQYSKMLERGQTYDTYGRVIRLSTKKLARTLNVLETVVPMTFFMLSVMAFVVCKVFGEELVIPMED